MPSAGRVCAYILEILLPRRKSDAVVETLEHHDLLRLSLPNGSLPYHDGRIKALVWEIKYRGNARALSLAGQHLAERLTEIVGEEIGRPLLIPVPMQESRKKERGYNQTELLCEAAMQHMDKIMYAIQYAPAALCKKNDSRPQQSLSRKRRLRNVHRSMEGDVSLAKNRVCIILDDVTTTGATFKEASRALQEAGAGKTLCIALADATS